MKKNKKLEHKEVRGILETNRYDTVINNIKQIISMKGLKQKAVAEKWGIPYFDQWNSLGFNKYNYAQYFQSDNTHLNTLGYQIMGYKQAMFLKNGIDTSEK